MYAVFSISSVSFYGKHNFFWCISLSMIISILTSNISIVDKGESQQNVMQLFDA